MTIHPIAKLLAWWLFWHPAPAVDPDVAAVRLIAEKCLHVGLRPHSDGAGAVVTVQITTCVIP